MSLYIANLGSPNLTDVGYVWKDSAGADIGARATAGVSEGEVGIYVADITPASGAQGIFWDSAAEDTDAFAFGDVRPENFEVLGIESDGDLTQVNSVLGHTAQTADHAASIAAILIDTGTSIPALIAALNNISTAQVNAEVDTAIAGANLATNATVGDIATTLGTPTDADIASDIAAVKSDTGTIAIETGDIASIYSDTNTTIPALIAALNNLSTAQVATELATYDAPTKAELDSAVSPLATATALATTDAVADAIKAVTDALPDAGALTTLIDHLTEIKGTTFTGSTDSLEAIRDRGDSAWAGGGGAPTAAQVADAVWDEAATDHNTSGTTGELLNNTSSLTGSGAFGITVTITDGTNPLENAKVRATEGLNSLLGTTDASGNVTFALDAATYTVAITKSGYAFTPLTRTVTAEETGTLTDDLVMSAVVVGVPSTPDMSIITGTVLFPNGSPANHVEIFFELVAVDGAESAGNILIQSPAIEVETDVNGDLPDPFELVRTDAITIATGTPQYRVTCEQLGVIGKLVTIDAATHDIATLLST
jgi:hypothetical protein